MLMTPTTMPLEFVTKSIDHKRLSDFVTFLRSLFPEEAVQKAIEDYRLGVTKDRDVIFFQLDCNDRCRTGKIMKYNRHTGRRIKDDTQGDKINWVHARLKSRGTLPQT